MGHVVIVPRRAMCSPVIEPLGFLPPPFAFSYKSLVPCIAIWRTYAVIFFCCKYQETLHVGCCLSYVKMVVSKVLIGEELDKEEEIYLSLQLVKCREGPIC